MQTTSRPSGHEIYTELSDKEGHNIPLSYYDLWAIIVCRTSLDGDWPRMREAAGMVYDPVRKYSLVDRLWQLDRALGGLPPIPQEVVDLHVRYAHIWFNQQPVLHG